MSEDQEFCLKWNNFQANITSEFGSLRDAEDFTDVTIACDGKRIQAHKVVLSACSPFFKELFKTNPCSHPIIFMRDVEACHMALLLEFMYAGQVNVAQTNLSSFLKTAESLKIRGLTDTSENIVNEETDNLNLQQKNTPIRDVKLQILSTNNVSSSQDDLQVQTDSSPPPKKTKTQTDTTNEEYNEKCEISDNTDPIEFLNHSIQPKNELANYLSDDADEKEDDMLTKIPRTDPTTLPDKVNIFPKNQYCTREIKQEFATEGLEVKSSEYNVNIANQSGAFISNSLENNFFSSANAAEGKNGLIKLADGLEINEDQLRGVKWNDYRKLTRGLAAILFSPAELATCSVTGQRWSRAESDERPVKPALNRIKVQAILSYVATQFPKVELRRIKQVLAHKCKENSTVLKMKAFRQNSQRFINKTDRRN